MRLRAEAHNFFFFFFPVDVFEFDFSARVFFSRFLFFLFSPHHIQPRPLIHHHLFFFFVAQEQKYDKSSQYNKNV